MMNPNISNPFTFFANISRMLYMTFLFSYDNKYPTPYPDHIIRLNANTILLSVCSWAKFEYIR